MNTELFLNGIILTLTAITFLVSIISLIIIYIRIHPLFSKVPTVLTCNTYLTLVLGSLMMLIIYGYSIYDDLNSCDSCNNYFCQLRAYFLHVFICAYFYSCLLQAIFRLFRIVFYKQRRLQSHGVFFVAIFVQWIISFLYILIHLFEHNFEYSSVAHGCWISFKNIRALFQALMIMYCGPILSICFMYAYIIRYTRRTIHVQQQQQTNNKRDLRVLKNIVILVVAAMGVGLATVFTLIYYIITNYLIPIAYHLQGLSISGGFLLGAIGFALTTPQIYEIIKIQRRITTSIMTIGEIPRTTN